MAGKRGPKNEAIVVLHIDDDPDDLEIFYKAVKTVNPLARCLLARDGREALNILRDAIVPDYIFLDVNMPRMNGKDVLAELRENRRLETVRVVMYSGHLHPRDAEEYSALGATQFLSKQNDFQRLCSSLEALFGPMG